MNFVGDEEEFDRYVAKQRKLNEWGDHVEIVAMSELFNKQVEVRDKDSVKGGNTVWFGWLVFASSL